MLLSLLGVLLVSYALLRFLLGLYFLMTLFRLARCRSEGLSSSFSLRFLMSWLVVGRYRERSLGSSVFRIVRSVLLLCSYVFGVLILRGCLPRRFLCFLPLPRKRSSFLPMMSSFLAILLLTSSSALSSG